MYFDTHTHINLDAFSHDQAAVIQRAYAASVSHMLVVGFDRTSMQEALRLAQTEKHMYAAIGWHPTEADQIQDEDWEWIVAQAQHPRVRAIGETGIDCYRQRADVASQIRLFKRHAALAHSCQKPLIIHNRDAHTLVYETLCTLRQQYSMPIILHSYSGGIEDVLRFRELDVYFSFSGVVTYKKATEVHQAAMHVPRERLLIETDAPFLAPHPFRGKRNEPAYVVYVAKQLSLLRNEDVTAQTFANACRILRTEK